MKMREEQFEQMHYVIRYPEDYSQNKKYPLLFFFHGAGGRGENIDTLKNNPIFSIISKHERFPFLIVAPLCNTNTWFDLFETIKKFVLMIEKKPYTDKKRVYAMGASMGGYLTWQLAMSMPERFAAIIPICGGGMYWNAERLKNVPVWAFHGGKDEIVFPEESRKMVEAVNRAGGIARLTIYPENGHDAWSDTYADYRVFQWLLSHKNSNTKKLEDNYRDSMIYG